jgi:hypothetical protein
MVRPSSCLDDHETGHGPRTEDTDMTKLNLTFHARGHERYAHRRTALRRGNFHIIPGSVRCLVVGRVPHYFGRATRLRRKSLITLVFDALRFAAQCFVAALRPHDSEPEAPVPS